VAGFCAGAVAGAACGGAAWPAAKEAATKREKIAVRKLKYIGRIGKSPLTGAAGQDEWQAIIL
jgi:hypothetical protein